MKTFYIVTSDEFGRFFLKRRKIAKAFRRWLRENGYTFTSTHLLE